MNKRHAFTFRRMTLVAGLMAVAACSRPLTQAETRFAADLFGPSLDAAKVRVAQGVGITPLYRTVPIAIVEVEATDAACVRTRQPRGAQPPQAFTVGNRIHFQTGLYASDMALTWPVALRVPHALVLAHELTHVWQWQNRSRTGYTPARAVAESWRLADPYFAAGGESGFLSFGFEQQAALVADYVCFTLSNPTHPRRAEIRAILEPILPLDAFEAAIAR